MDTATKTTKILILGGGFGGFFAALQLEKSLAKMPNVEVTLVSQDDYLLFTPMLHEVASAELDPGDIAFPIRRSFRKVRVLRANVMALDPVKQMVTITTDFGIHERVLAYDHVVVALGSESRYFDDLTKTHALGMKTLYDAIFLRTQLVAKLESANVQTDMSLQQAMLTFVVAGGGFSGVETAGAINDFLRETAHYYPGLDPKLIRVVVAEGGPRLLPEFSEDLAQYSLEQLKQSGVEVHLNSKVEPYDGKTVRLGGGTEIPSDTLIWTAGVSPASLLKDLLHPKERGRLIMAETMRSAEYPSLWAVGDSAHIPDENGKPYPTTAQNAMRQGKVVAMNLEAEVTGKGAIVPFRYKSQGSLAAIGRRRGVANVFGFKFSGFFAWFLWRSAYLYKLPGLSRKIRVMLRWTVSIFFGPDPVQLLTDRDLKQLAARVAATPMPPTLTKV